MASVLFLAPDDLGETVLTTGALACVLSDGDRVHVSAPDEARALFRAAPVRVSWLPPRLSPRWFIGAWMRRPFDVVLDARANTISRWAPGSKRYALTPQTFLRHRCEDWAAALGAERALAPKLWIDDSARAAAEAIAPADGAPLLVLAPGGVAADKRWGGERYAAVARRLVGGPLQGARIVAVGAAARDARIVGDIVRGLDADGIAALDLGQGMDLLAAAAVMERATLCLGNDNALTHIAAAAGAPTLTLFGPTDERVRAPWGSRARTLRGRALEDIATQGGAAMEAIGIDMAEAAALEVLQAGGLR